MTQTDRQAQLFSIKLAALVRDHSGDLRGGGSAAPDVGSDTRSDVATAKLGVFGRGAALTRGPDAWVLVEEYPTRGLGPAMAWARQQQCATLNVLAEQSTGVLTRQAQHFREPPTVWHVEGRVLFPAIPEPFPVSAAVSIEHESMLQLIVAGGAVPSVEHGVLAGEVAGLEVCRVVTDRHTGEVRLEVGVGAHDREAFQIIHGDKPPVEALAGVVQAVAPHRLPHASPHPLNRLAPERLLRWELMADPSLVGLSMLSPAEPPFPRPNLKDPFPAVAVGATAAGDPVVVVCSVGVDLDVVPFAADARPFLGLDRADLLLALPSRDAHRVTLDLASRLKYPAHIVTIDL